MFLLFAPIMAQGRDARTRKPHEASYDAACALMLALDPLQASGNAACCEKTT